MRTWVNGEMLTDPDAPAVAARDHGMTVGDGVFEVIKVVDGRLFAVERARRFVDFTIPCFRDRNWRLRKCARVN